MVAVVALGTMEQPIFLFSFVFNQLPMNFNLNKSFCPTESSAIFFLRLKPNGLVLRYIFDDWLKHIRASN